MMTGHIRYIPNFVPVEKRVDSKTQCQKFKIHSSEIPATCHLSEYLISANHVHNYSTSFSSIGHSHIRQ
jgi:hypothetical protein